MAEHSNASVSRILPLDRRYWRTLCRHLSLIIGYLTQAEQELLELWSSVEKEKAAARERGLLQARSTKTQQRQTRAGMKVGPSKLISPMHCAVIPSHSRSAKP